MLSAEAQAPPQPQRGRTAAVTESSPNNAPGRPDRPTFNDVLALYRMPPPGPDHYKARRQLWLTPRPDRPQSLPEARSTSVARTKLQEMLESPGAVYSDSCWHSGIEKVWRGLCKGDRLKHRLPMALIIKVVHSSWVRDSTWPTGVQAPIPDDELPEGIVEEPIVLDTWTPCLHTIGMEVKPAER